MVVDSAEDLLSVTEAAQALSVSVPTIKRWLKAGRLPAYHLGPRYIRIRRSDLARVLTPLPREGVTPVPERAVEGLVPLPTERVAPPLTDAEVAQALRAMQDAARLRAAMRARRGGQPLAPSWEMLREMREARSTRDA